MLVILFSCGVVGLVCFLLGKAVRLNQDIRLGQIVADHPDAPEDSLINMRTGEVLYPGTRRYDKAIKKSRVRFK